MDAETAISPETAILIVDDDPGIRDTMSDYLAANGFTVGQAGDAAAMRNRLQERTWALIVLDVMLPGEDGLSILRELQRTSGPPAIMLSAMGSDIDRIIGLEIGAEDYLAKPCNPRELLARIRTVLRRHDRDNAPPLPASHSSQEDKPVLHFAGWRLDPWSRILRDPQQAIVTLSEGEFRLLLVFLEHPRHILSREQLLDLSRRSENEAFDRAIDVQISRLRKKLHTAPELELIRTIRNEGYMFLATVEGATG